MGGSDPDGDALVWTFDADGDAVAEATGTGAQLPSAFVHAYATAGDYTAALSVSDGALSTVSTVAVSVT